MSRAIYAVGDTVRLKADLFRRADGGGICRIAGILPSDHGEAQYRVRLGNETFERRILASDIEASEAVSGRSATGSRPSLGGKEPWLKPSTIRTRK
jgi:hypothetical protein